MARKAYVEQGILGNVPCPAYVAYFMNLRHEFLSFRLKKMIGQNLGLVGLFRKFYA